MLALVGLTLPGCLGQLSDADEGPHASVSGPPHGHRETEPPKAPAAPSTDSLTDESRRLVRLPVVEGVQRVDELDR